MPYARVIPIPVGKVGDCKAMIAEMLGPRCDEFEKALIGEGITEQYFWIQSGPEGDFLIISNDGDGQLRERIREIRARSQEPFDVWFREEWKRALHIDLTKPEPGPRVEQVGGWVADTTRREQAEAQRSRTTSTKRRTG